MPWIDPNETDPATWRGTDSRDDVRTGSDMRGVIERALGTDLPYQYRCDEHWDSAFVPDTFRSRDYTHAKLLYDCGVTDDRRIKLLTRGHLWGDGEDHQRFKSQYRRPPPPTDTVPFDEYEVWVRHQFGTVDYDEDGGLTFSSDPNRTEETVRALDWEELYPPVRVKLAELELVRNPSFARYRLDELSEWGRYRGIFEFDPDAFGLAP